MNEDVVDKIVNASYIYAKTMPWCPHHYTLRKEWENDEDFARAVEFIRANGVQEPYYGRIMTYFYHNGYKYWTMGNPVEKTRLINRAKVD